MLVARSFRTVLGLIPGETKTSGRPAEETKGANQIPRYLAIAENSSRRGKCDDTMGEYNVVLAYEPATRDARQGLERILQDKRHNLCLEALNYESADCIPLANAARLLGVPGLLGLHD